MISYEEQWRKKMESGISQEFVAREAISYFCHSQRQAKQK